jgi:UDP-glucose 6-dehydrogenase
MEYNNEMKEVFVKRNTIEKGFFASSLHQKFKMLEDEYSISLIKAKEEMDEIRKTKILELMTKLYQAEAQAFSKNTLAVFGKQNVEKTTEDYDKDVENIFGSEKIVSFKKVAAK